MSYNMNEPGQIFWGINMRESERAKQLPVIDENLFYRLLEGPGSVRVDIIMFEQCYLPFVSFSACGDMPIVHYGVIIRNGTAPIAARTADELLCILRDMTDGRMSVQLHLPLSDSLNTRMSSDCTNQGITETLDINSFLASNDGPRAAVYFM